ncbi:MAG: thioesterase family protein [Myxococcota bacterium]
MTDAASFDAWLTPTRVDEGRFAWHVPPGMEQGRATFGGLVLGALTRAMRMAEPDAERRLRWLAGELVGNVGVGPATIDVALVRRGGAVSTWRAELRQGDGVAAHASGIFGAPRSLPDLPAAVSARRLAPPVLPPWRELAPMPPVPIAPAFTRHFEYRVHATLPFSGASEALTTGYVRPRAATAIHDDALLVALADAWWIAAMVVLPRPRPAATLGFELELHAAPETLVWDEPLAHRGELLALSDGYASETRELWTPDGRLVCLNRQLVAIIK